MPSGSADCHLRPCCPFPTPFSHVLQLQPALCPVWQTFLFYLPSVCPSSAFFFKVALSALSSLSSVEIGATHCFLETWTSFGWMFLASSNSTMPKYFHVYKSKLGPGIVLPLIKRPLTMMWCGIFWVCTALLFSGGQIPLNPHGSLCLQWKFVATGFFSPSVNVKKCFSQGAQIGIMWAFLITHFLTQ